MGLFECISIESSGWLFIFKTLSAKMASGDIKKSAQSLIGLSIQQLKNVLGAPPKSAMPSILYQYLYIRGLTSFDEMRYISAADRLTLNERFTLNYPAITNSVESYANGPRRLTLVYPDLVSPINTTLIPRVDHFVPDLAAAARKKYMEPPKDSNGDNNEITRDTRGTLCLSTHVHHPISGHLVPLSTSQLISQVMVGLKEAGDFPRQSKKKAVPRNITQIAFTVCSPPCLSFFSSRNLIRID